MDIEPFPTRQARLLLPVLVALLAGCTAPSAPRTESAGPSAEMRPSSPPAGTTPASDPAAASAADLRDPLYRRQLDQALLARGWQPLGTAAAAGADPSGLHYFQPGTARRQGNGVTVAQLLVPGLPETSGQRSGATVLLREFDCRNRTVRTADARAFSDRTASQPASARPDPRFIGPGTPQALVPGSATQRLFTLSCEGRGSGSGLRIAAERVLTNAHVVVGCRRIEASLDGRRVSAAIVGQDTANDLALLSVTGLPPPPAALAAGLPVRRSAVTGESVTVTGYPLASVLASDMNVQVGVVNALGGLNNHPGQFQMSAPLQPGNSGGPVLDKSGQVLGLVVARSSSLFNARYNATAVNFAIRPETIRPFLSAQGVAYADGVPGPRLDTEDIADQARAFTVKIDCFERMLGR
jgi:hypothetical protein